VSQETALSESRAQYARTLERELGNVVAQLASLPEVARIILFGSYAAGRRDLLTDLDLLVVMSSEQDFVRRTADLYGRISTAVDVDLLVYTPEEFDRLRERGFVRQALETGKVVYEKERAGGS
jgi:predicted nucleotidyltransferase